MINKREYFRVNTFGRSCELRYGKSTSLGKLINLSTSGALVAVDYDKFETDVVLKFEINGSTFERKAKILRRIFTKKDRTKLALSFEKYTEKERAHLHQSLLIQETMRLNSENELE